jgi:hypothetical protein
VKNDLIQLLRSADPFPTGSELPVSEIHPRLQTKLAKTSRSFYASKDRSVRRKPRTSFQLRAFCSAVGLVMAVSVFLVLSDLERETPQQKLVVTAGQPQRLDISERFPLDPMIFPALIDKSADPLRLLPPDALQNWCRLESSPSTDQKASFDFSPELTVYANLENTKLVSILARTPNSGATSPFGTQFSFHMPDLRGTKGLLTQFVGGDPSDPFEMGSAMVNTSTTSYGIRTMGIPDSEIMFLANELLTGSSARNRPAVGEAGYLRQWRPLPAASPDRIASVFPLAGCQPDSTLSLHIRDQPATRQTLEEELYTNTIGSFEVFRAHKVRLVRATDSNAILFTSFANPKPIKSKLMWLEKGRIVILSSDLPGPKLVALAQTLTPSTTKQWGEIRSRTVTGPPNESAPESIANEATFNAFSVGLLNGTPVASPQKVEGLTFPDGTKVRIGLYQHFSGSLVLACTLIPTELQSLPKDIRGFEKLSLGSSAYARSISPNDSTEPTVLVGVQSIVSRAVQTRPDGTEQILQLTNAKITPNIRWAVLKQTKGESLGSLEFFDVNGRLISRFG